MNMSHTIYKGGEIYECQVSFLASAFSVNDLSIDSVTRASDGFDIDPETFQNSLTPEEEEMLDQACLQYTDDLVQYGEDIKS